MFYKKLFYGLSFFAFLSGAHPVAAQTEKIDFFEVIQNDSVALYFNRDFNFTEKECFDYIRRIRVTEKGDFNGYFEDRSIDNMLLGKGVYINGVKQGYFEIYYSNGKPFSKGHYEQDVPVGIWEYFFESGLPERTINISDSVIFLLRNVDITGIVRVQNGAGRFDGIVSGALNFGGIPSTGVVVDGKPDGRWILPAADRSPLYSEKFDHGKLIRTSMASKRKVKEDHIAPMLNRFFLTNYLSLLEDFHAQRCSESQQYFFNRYPSDLRAFSAELRQKIAYLIESDLRSHRDKYYVFGDNFMSLQFSVDEKGKAYDFKLLSDWGARFFHLAQNSINKTVFSTNNKVMYFHLKLSYAGGHRYRYTFRFSKRDRNK